MWYGLLFAAAAAVVVVAGTFLTRFADALARHSGVGRLWIGAILLAAATSLPELGTGISAVRLGALDLALGDLFGASMANMLILAMVDLLSRRRPVLRSATIEHALSASLGITLLGLGAAFVLAPSGVMVAGVSVESIVLLGVYVLGSRAVYRHARRESAGGRPATVPDVEPPAPDGEPPPVSRRHAIAGFAVSAAVILVAAPWLALSADQVAAATGLGETFLGTWLVGLSTALPELVAAVAAVRMGAIDLAVGNLFGSTAINMALLFGIDLAHTDGPMFAAASRAHALSGLFGAVLTTLGLAAVVYRARKRFAVVEPDSALILVMYLAALALLYLNRGLT